MFIFVAAAAAAAVPAAAKADLECLTLYAAASGTAKSEEEKMPALMGTAYFFGRFDAIAPNVDLAGAVRDTGVALDAMGQEKVKALGAACDSKFKLMGQRFTAAGETLKK